jgi:excinuclease ABC subunit A
MSTRPATPAPRSEDGATGRTKDFPEREGDWIRIRGARQNNLRNIDVDVPRNRLVAITGVSGSGKSSLAFDTLFREGQRRFLETLSAYARQFLGRMEKPAVDHVEGLSPAIAVDQKAVPRGPRSTVGTITEIVDHLRVLYARAGTARCPEHGEPLATQTAEAIVAQIAAAFGGQAVHVLAPYVRDRKGHHRPALDELAKKGFVRARVDGAVVRIEDTGELERYKRHTIEAVVDRLRLKREAGTDELEAAALTRLREAVAGALELGEGDVVVLGEPAGPGGDGAARERAWSTLRACSRCGYEAPPLEPRTFSFNSPHGACPTCDGLGLLRAPSERKVVADATKTIRAGALAVTRQSGGKLVFPNVGFAFLEKVGKHAGFDLDTPWRDLPAAAQRAVLYGTGERRFEDTGSWDGERSAGQVTWRRRYRGVIPALSRAWKQGGRRKLVERYLDVETCPDCEGTRLSAFARAVHVGGVGIAELLKSPVRDVGPLLDAMELTRREGEIARGLLGEIRRRLGFLQQVGLGYLTLDRAADTLSGGEAQRIRLAAQLGAGLQGVLYVLDEPSIGLHARDHGRLLGALESLRDAGNSVVVVEHDEATLRAADWVIDIGPGAGAHGGHVVAQGAPVDVAQADSPTGQLLRGELPMPAPAERRPCDGERLVVRGARGFNLKAVDVAFPLDAFVCVTGVSGSGKSTLVDGTLARAVARHLGREVPSPREHDAVEGLEHVEDLVHVTSSPIGRTPRSNPATYSGAFTPIRDLFASLPEAKMHGWEPGRFSFNVAGGRCERCQGAGAEYVELQFLAPVTVPCPDCGGRRFRDETLEVRYRGHSIADVLALTIEEAAVLFADIPKVARPLVTLVEVGLGYLRLGQPSTTISGGEAQRVKLAKHLQKRSRKHTLYLLDEPTTGLHQKDVARLVGALQALVDQGNTVLVIEHNLDVVRAADHVIDLGPEGGAEGGRLIAAGPPEEIEAAPESHTGRALRDDAHRRLARPERPPADLLLAPSTHIRVRGARTHNLQNVDVDVPRDKLTVVTGVSGSGKSSLALDTIHAAGRQRFVESLSTYARQFLASRDRPPVDTIDGLGPSVAVEASTSHGHPRSTVATTTEIHDHLRVLWARAGVRRCPAHGEQLRRSDASGVAKAVVKALAGKRGWIVAPMFGPGADDPDVADSAGDLARAFGEAAGEWRKAGYARALVDGVEVRLDGELPQPRAGARVDLVIDRLAFDAKERSRIAEAVETAESLAGGRVSVVVKAIGKAARLEFSTHGACTKCGFRLEHELEPRHFSFNTHVGACPSCDGLGERWHADGELLVDRPDLPLVDERGGKTGVSGKLGRYLTKGKGFYEHLLRTVAASHRIDLEKPFEQLTEKQRELLLHGTGARRQYTVEVEKLGKSFEITTNYTAEWPGLCGHVDAWHARSEDPEWRAILESFMRQRPCRACRGERLAPGPRAVSVGRKRLPEVLALTVEETLTWLVALKLPKSRMQGVRQVVDELAGRVGMLERVGLGYLTLDRSVATLSSGEARRVRLSASLGSHLVGVCYVLDEPTVGLHPADVDKLGDALFALRDGGNTVLVVEHDEALMRRADWLIDMGPGAGRFGGRVMFSGTPDDARRSTESLTGRALAGKLPLVRPEDARAGTVRAAPPGEEVGVRGARLHNLKDVDLTVRYGELTGVCGPSGSGKSTLVLDCLVPALQAERAEGRWRAVVGAAGGGRRTVLVDASPIGRTPASVPATAVGLMKPLRDLFARTPDARMRGFTGSHFSFNSNAGRCQACEGLGATKVEMQFLADLWLTCEECDGKRYRPEVLGVRYRGRSIADVLDMSAEEALELLGEVPALARPLATLVDVGLGYLSLGQSSTTLSGGEAQRVKLATELCRASDDVRSVPTIVVLDEPSTGLHQADVVHLYRVLARLASRGDAVVVIEHHTGLLAACDRLVELGPAGGAAGGRVIAGGTPAELARDPRSVTGPWLAGAAVPALPRAKGKRGAGEARAGETTRRSKEGVAP